MRARSPGADRPDVMIAGGGTAGHTNPGIAVAEALVAAGVGSDRIVFVGSTRGNEATLVPAAGFELVTLPGRGIPRRLDLQAIRSSAELARGMGAALGLVRSVDPQVVLCLGGFAAFGPSMAALALRKPVVVSEQNARASQVNRIVGRFAAACALPFPDTDLSHRPVLTGNPIRRAVLDALDDDDGRRRREIRDRMGVGDRTLVAVWSGSLGARRVNDAVRELAVRWRDRADIVIHHVVGRRYPEMLERPAGVGTLDYRAVPYEEDMPSLLLAADLAITRAGASTIAELSVAALPAVVVPLPRAPRDHQYHNAQELVSVGRAVLVADDQLDGDALEEAVTPLLATETRTAMSARRPGVDHASAARSVAELLLDHLQDSGR